MNRFPRQEPTSESEQRMRSVVDHVVDGIITIEATGTVTTFNPAAERIFGYRSEEIIGKNVKVLMPEPFHSQHDGYIGNYLRSGQAKIIGIGREVIGQRKDGATFPMELAISEFRLGDDRFFTGIVRDITERKRAEAELRDAEERMRSVVNHVVDGIISIDESGRIESFNPAAQKIFGYAREEVIGQNVKMLMPEPYHSEHDGYIKNYTTTGKAKIIGVGREVTGRRKDGDTFPMELAVSEFHIRARRYFTGIVRDIGERKRAEAALRESDERFRLMVESVQDYAILMLDPQGRVASWNVGAERTEGWQADEIIGRHFSCFYTEDDIATGKPQRELDAAISGRQFEDENWRVRKDGSRFWANVVITALRDASGELRGFAKVTRDVTKRKEAEDALKEADRQKNEFLAMLGHELRNPLAPLRNALYLLKTGSAGEGVAEVHAMMERQLQQLVRLVDDLLDVSRIIGGKIDLRREEVDLAVAVQRAVETAKPVIDAHGHVLNLSLPAAPIHVFGDLVRLAQAISNLLTNAAKYSHTAAPIDLTVRRIDDDAVISVKDRGIGMRPQLLPRVFELFVQGDSALARSKGGLGIGLTLVKRLVEMHGGVVTAASEGEGRGSEFHIRLPARRTEVDALRDGPSRAIAPKGPSRRVLVVDDNVDAADSIARILRLFGHEVRCAHDGTTALAAAPDYLPEVVVLDIGLPGMDGYEIARRLRQMESLAGTRIVAVTGYGQEEDRLRSRQSGFDEHLTKPVDPQSLQSFVAKESLR